MKNKEKEDRYPKEKTLYEALSELYLNCKRDGNGYGLGYLRPFNVKPPKKITKSHIMWLRECRDSQDRYKLLSEVTYDIKNKQTKDRFDSLLMLLSLDWLYLGDKKDPNEFTFFSALVLCSYALKYPKCMWHPEEYADGYEPGFHDLRCFLYLLEEGLVPVYYPKDNTWALFGGRKRKRLWKGRI